MSNLFELVLNSISRVTRRQKVIIYQMGKVASSSIKSSLTGLNKIDITYTHNLNSSYTEELNDIKEEKGWEITVSPESVRKIWSEIKDEKQLKVITLVREPVGRNISAYFQNLGVIFGQKDVHNQLTYDELFDGFVQKYPHSIPIAWFDKEFKQTLGIDVYKYEFPKKEGALIIKEGKYHVLIIRSDINDALKQQYIEKLLSTKGIVLKQENLSAGKPYKDVYKNFIDNVKFPETYLSEMLDSKYARHFFENSERELLKEKWRGTHTNNEY